MSTFVKTWNKQHRILSEKLSKSEWDEEVVKLFLDEHAALHAGQLSQDDLENYPLHSLEDELLNDITDEQFRRIPSNNERSVAWSVWHIARIEDATMNVLVAGKVQVLEQGQWLPRLNIAQRHTGNLMTKEEIANLSATIDMMALRAYRLAVGRQTQSIIKTLPPGDLAMKVDPARLQLLAETGTVREEANDLLVYWGKKTIAGLLLMPATRHNLVHLNEALRLKRRRM